MPLGGFVPANVRYGRSVFPAQPEQEGLSSEMAGTLQSIQAGQPMFDPSSARFSPIPPSQMMSPGQRASQSVPGPGAIGGGIEGTAGLPFASQLGLGTGGGFGSPASPGVQPSPTSPVSPTSQVVANMIQSSGPQAFSGPQPSPSTMFGQTPTQFAGQPISALVPAPGFMDSFGGSNSQEPLSPLVNPNQLSFLDLMREANRGNMDVAGKDTGTSETSPGERSY